VQVAYQDTDAGSTVLPYYNASNPSVAWSGPNNTGVSQNTVRKGQCLVQVKAGVAATTGTQVTPSPDAGFTGLFAVTVANGQTTITSGNIVQLATAPFITPKLSGILAAIQNGTGLYAADTSVSANTITVAFSPPISSLVAGMSVRVKVANTNTGATVMNVGTGNVAVTLQDGTALTPGAVQANGVYLFTYDGNHWQLQNILNTIGLGQCYFQYTSATVCTLIPYKGNKVSFPSGAVATLGSSGITTTINNASLNGTAGQTLSASTTYYAYLWNNGSNFVIDWSATGYAIDANSGIAVKSGDATRVLVGMAKTDATPHFNQSDGLLNVVSYFNPKPLRSRTTFSTDRSTTSTSFVELNTEIRNSFVNIEGRPVQYAITGSSYNSTANQNSTTGIAFNGTTPEQEVSSGVSSTTNASCPISIFGYKTGLTDGSNYATLLAEVPANTGTWKSATNNAYGTVTLEVIVNG
jgi:hypothetical protein